MKTRTCPLESDVLAAVLGGNLAGELQSHVHECADCSEVAGLATLVHDDYTRALGSAQVPSANVVWVRAQIRAREEAARAAARPIVLTQAIAIAALIGLLVSVAGRLSLSFWAWPVMGDAFSPLVLGLSAALLCALVFAPVAVYLAFSRD